MKKFLVAATALSALLAGCGEEPAEHNDADIAFAQQMIPHHAQAVEMADLVPAAGGGNDVQRIAARIRNAQQPEIDQMTEWLEEWGEPLDAGHEGHGGHEGAGMMTDEQMAQLRETSGDEFDQLWLELMIAHHEGAVEMAQTEIADGQDPEAIELAENIVGAQEAEITEMQELLR